MFSLSLSATVLEVGLGQDFTYNTIQSAVDAVVDYDTVLVHPGRYLENVEVLEKSLTLGSLFLTTGDEAYIDSTIIDGNDEWRVLFFKHNRYLPSVKWVNVSGLSITNGNTLTNHNSLPEGVSTHGGGIAINGYSYQNQQISIIEYCKIYNSTSRSGGGVAVVESNIKMQSCEIFDNNGGQKGGGFYCVGLDYQLEFSTEHPNSIYNNSAGRGRDIFGGTINTNPAQINGLYFDRNHPCL